MLRPQSTIAWNSSILPWMGMVALLVAAGAAYFPGLGAGFQFDDFVNLDQIGATGPVDDWATFWRYLTSGTADPTGRPLSLLSFLLDARDWPADPRPFLRTNVALHLLNGVLLWRAIHGLEKGLHVPAAKPTWIPVVASGMWILHPLFVSTTLYAVQRQAMLPATFTLLGIIGYSWGRTRLAGPDARWAFAAMAASVLVATTLATLSKANGVLLPMLLAVIELTIWKRLPVPPERCRPFLVLRWVLLYLPTAILLAYVLSRLPGIFEPNPERGWTSAQRAMTQSRVLTDYLSLLVWPTSNSTGLFNDAYSPSVSLFSPPSTALSMVFLGALAAGAILLRDAYPRFACALLFFLAGHWLESTIVPLELYFEHRNYLPAMLIFWPIAALPSRLPVRPVLAAAICVALLALLGSMTLRRATEWGNPARRDSVAAANSPESVRALAISGMSRAQRGDPPGAEAAFALALGRFPGETQLVFNKIDAACRWRALQPNDVRLVDHTLRNVRRGRILVHQWLTKAIEAARHGECRGLTVGVVSDWVLAAEAGFLPGETSVRQQTVEPLKARLALARHDPPAAKEHFAVAVSASRNPDAIALAVTELARAGYYSEALSLLEQSQGLHPDVVRPRSGMPWLHDWILRRQGYWSNEFRVLEENLRAELAASKEPRSRN